MTAYRDERDSARAALAAARVRAATTAAELTAIPGWLRVGDPNRLTDAAQQAQAVHAVQLGTDLDAIHRGIAALHAELDALDGPPTESIRLFLEWSAWLESLTDAQTLLERLVPDPRRRFLGATPAMTPDTAQRMLDVIAANGGQVGDGQAFIDAAGLHDDDVWDLVFTARTRLDPLVEGHVVGVLLPLRLETRYARRATDEDPWRLRVRIFPDAIALAGAPLPANNLEAELVATCWTHAAGDLTTDAGAAAFTALAGAVGGPRAAFLLRSVPVVPGDDGFVPAVEHAPPVDRRSEYRAALPDAIQLWGDWGAGLQPLGQPLRPDRGVIAAQANVGDAMADLRPEHVPELWWTSYAAAEKAGLATEVELPGGPHLDVLVATGLSDLAAGDVFVAHAGHGDLAVVAPMSPSNTIAGRPAADLGRDPAAWLEVARSAGTGTAAGLAGALTGGWALDGVPTADTGLLEVVPTLVTALWPVLWQRWLKDVEHAAQVYELADWAARVLAPLGPFPALRVGAVPYGVLPAVDPAAWTRGPRDAVWEEAVTFAAARVLGPWAAAAEAGGTAAGATADRLLDVIGHVPTSRELGSRQFIPLEILAALKAIVIGMGPGDVVAAWNAMAAPALQVEPAPHRRYMPFGYVQPGVRGRGGVRERLERYLAEPAESLAHAADREREDDPPLLVRLLRQSLLLTMAEASRLDADFASWTPPYDIPPFRAERLAEDGSFGSPEERLPDEAEQLLAQHPPDPQAVVIARQFTDVRDAVRRLADLDEALLPEGPLAPAVAAVIDTSSHRFDPWVTALGTRRLRRLDARGVPRLIGAYGWVDDLSPAEDPTPPTSAGVLHAPGSAQALAAAVLRDHAIHGDDPRWRMNVRSDLARLAARLAGDVRLGVHISEALGREIERRAGDPATVLELRRRFPARPEWTGRRVCDGQLVLAAPAGGLPAGVPPLDDLRRVVDTYGDLLVADAVHDLVSGRASSAQEAMEAAAGLGAPAELRMLKSRREGASVRTTVLVALPPGSADPASPVSVADPALAALLRDELPAAEAWTWTAGGAAAITLAELDLDVADVVLQPQSRLDALATAALGAAPTGGTAGVHRAVLDELCSLLAIQDGLPDVAGGPAAGATQLRARLTTLRGLAATLVADPQALAQAARRWGLPDQGAADVLAARIAAAGDPAGDATADALGLGERIRALLAPASGLPLVCTAPAPATVAASGLDRDWLEIVAAVRPALARLEAHQVRTAWPAGATTPDRLWTVPARGQRDVIVYGPGVGQAGEVGLALLDDWAETVPSRRHVTHAAFGFDAPRARPPQSVLLAVPSDEAVPLTPEALPGIVLATRRLARARMARPDHLGDWSLAVPTSMVLTSGPAGATLVEPS